MQNFSNVYNLELLYIIFLFIKKNYINNSRFDIKLLLIIYLRSYFDCEALIINMKMVCNFPNIIMCVCVCPYYSENNCLFKLNNNFKYITIIYIYIYSNYY